MIDLISDTVTLPSEEMLEQVLKAHLGDAGRENADGRGEDLTTNELEDMAAQLTGKEAAMFAPTGTMGNTCAVLAWCKPGDNVLVEKNQHMYVTEKICFMEDGFRMQPSFYQLDSNGNVDISSISTTLDNDNIRLVCIENTNNIFNGKCMTVDSMTRLHALCSERYIPIHMDGARLFNAADALGVSIQALTNQCDSVMFCLSKGLGAPIGSLLCGSKEFIQRARSWRKLLGGTMRQTGVMTSCGIYALKHHVKRLHEDRERTQRLASLLSDVQTLHPDPAPQSNILMFDMEGTGMTPVEFCNALLVRGIRAGTSMDTKVRFVLHQEITDEDVDYVSKQVMEIDKELTLNH